MTTGLNSSTTTTRTRTVLLCCALLPVLTWAAFCLILDNDFIEFDDGLYVTQNPYVLSGLNWDSVKWTFQTTKTSNWIPLTWLSHMLDTELFGLDPGLHHLTNLILHSLNTVLVFLLLYRLTGRPWAAFWAAVLFALHPLRAESVAWASERKDTLSTFFGLLALLAYGTWAQHKKRVHYVLACLALMAGLMSKAMLVTWPFLFLLLDYWLKRLQKAGGGFDHRTLTRLVVEKIPFFAICLAFSVIAYWAQDEGGSIVSTDYLPLAFRLQNVWISYVTYLKMTFFPDAMGVFYPLDPKTITFSRAVVPFVVIVIVTAVFFRLRKSRPYLLVGWLWFLGTLVPVIGLVQIGVQAVADRYTYVPSIGLSMLVAFWVADVAGRRVWWRRAAVATAVLVAGFLMVKTWIQTAYWKNSLTLYAHTLNVTENNYTMHLNYGCALANVKDFENAMVQFEKAAQTNPKSASPLEKMAQVHIAHGDHGRAIKLLNEALTKNDAEPGRDLQNLGLCYLRMRQFDTALEYFNKAIALEPANSRVIASIAEAYQQQGDWQTALDYYQRALAVEADADALLNKLALFYIEKDNPLYSPAKALDYVEQACRRSCFRDITPIRTMLLVLQAEPALEQSLSPDFVGELQARLKELKLQPLP